MATRDVVVRIRAEVGNFKRDMDAAAQAASKAADKTKQSLTEAGQATTSNLGSMATAAQTHEAAWSKLSTGMVAGGTAVVGGLALATKAAMDWESAWTGVTKTVDGSPEQMAQLESELRGLAKTLPSTHTEIAGVAEAAGQLGVAREDVSGFTKTMVDLGESTNLTAEDAATNIAQISNVMGTMGREGSEGVERFGSALVALGNDGASTEAEILSMAQRISGAGATIGASESDVLALSNTLASMGVKAELGGGVTTRVLLKMRTAADEGGESLQAFADVAGTSADDFAAKFREAPMEALDMVAQGISRVNEEGGNVTATLKDMGIKGTEETQVMLALANSGTLLADSLKLGASAWEENSALIDEAGKRYETAESRIKIAWNNIKDAGIEAGAVILPVVASIADGIADLAGWFSDLPAPVQAALTGLAGIAGVGALAAGGLMKIVPSAIETVAQMRALATDMPRASKALGGLAKAAGIAGAAIIGLQVLGEILSDEYVEPAENLAKGIENVAKASKEAGDAPAQMRGFNEVFQSFRDGVGAVNDTTTAINALDESFSKWSTVAGSDRSGGVEGITEALSVLADPSMMDGLNEKLNFMNDWFNLPDDRLTEMKTRFADLGTEMATFVSAGDMETASTTFREVAKAANEVGMSENEALNLMPAFRDELRAQAEAAGVSVTQQDLLKWALSGVAPAAVAASQGLSETQNALGQTTQSAAEAAEAVDKYYDSLVAAGLVTISTREAQMGFEEAIDAANAALEKNGEVMGFATEKGRENEAALNNLGARALSAFEHIKNGSGDLGDMSEALGRGREEVIAMATGMGYSEKAAAALADSMGLIPSNVVTEFDINTDDVGQRILDLHEIIQGTPDKTITLDDNSPEVRRALEDLGYVITELPDGRIEVTDDGTAETTGKKADAVAEKYREAQIKAQATNVEGADGQLDGVAAPRVAPITADAATGTAEAELSALARPRFASLTVTQRFVPGAPEPGNGPITGQFGRKRFGGKLPSFQTGGRLPYTGMGTDMILGIGSDGRPTANVDDGEWIIREEQADKFDTALQMINSDHPAVQHLASFASGGKVGAAEKRVASARKAYQSIDGKKANKARKRAAKDQLDAAQAELKATKAEQKKSAEAAKEARERAGRINESRFDLARDLKRGSITEAFTSGSGMSEVDKMFRQSFNKDLSKGKRSRLRSSAYGMERDLLRLEKQSERVEKALGKAVERRDELLAAQKGVQSSMVGSFDLAGLSGQKDDLGYNRFVGKKGLLSFGKEKATGARKLAYKAQKLQKLGFHESMIQQVIEEWTGSGTFELADAMLEMNKTERSSFNKSFKSVERYGSYTGKSLTNAMSKGGIDAAQGLVDGWESKTKEVESSFYKLGKSAEKAFRKSLDMHSPSRTLAASGRDALDGILVGTDDRRQAVVDAYTKLGQEVSTAYRTDLSVGAGAGNRAAGYATVRESAGLTIDYDKLAEAFSRVQIESPVVFDRHTSARVVQVGTKLVSRNK